MNTKILDGKTYNYESAETVCPTITIHGKPYCVLKDCYHRAIGAVCPPEAPKGWFRDTDLVVKWNDPSELPKYWIEG